MKAMQEEYYIPPQVEVVEVLCEAGCRSSIETGASIVDWEDGGTVNGRAM